VIPHALYLLPPYLLLRSFAIWDPMHKFRFIQKFVITVGIIARSLLLEGNSFAENDWPNWRGPLGNGTAPSANPPRNWSPETNIKWRAPIPGNGSSTPIVWKNQAIVLASEEVESEDVIEGVLLEAARPVPMALNLGTVTLETRSVRERAEDSYLAEQKLTRANKIHRFCVLSFDLESGAKLWETEVTRQLPHEPCHSTNTFASASPITDGEHIYASFGSRGIFCLDMQGKLKWQFAQGRMQTVGSFGEGASPALYKDFLVIPWDHEGESCLIALNAKNGYIKWKIAREERTNWATPTIVEHNGTTQVIVNGRTVRSYDLSTVEQIWSCPGQTEQAIPTPLVSNGHVFVMSGLRGWACYAISLDARGNLTEGSEPIKWTLKKHTPYVPSPCIYDGNLYLFNESTRTLSVIDEKTGNPVLPPKRMTELGEVYSSIGAANGMLFITDRTGKTIVLDAKSLDLISENQIDETVNASLVFVGQEILIRASNQIICLKQSE